ncbi:hypothetical protein GCM10010211_40460 [Streptomyces albospinus]|uniref:Transposase n=1 Tax=Streptomyces albospinus TaxID=285515 RepID=A0ABQ2V5Y6_9ACTN|nr:hypothetical protein GCM10010211_40460 [Streptomyces albospinus]
MDDHLLIRRYGFCHGLTCRGVHRRGTAEPVHERSSPLNLPLGKRLTEQPTPVVTKEIHARRGDPGAVAATRRENGVDLWARWEVSGAEHTVRWCRGRFRWLPGSSHHGADREIPGRRRGPK